MADEFLRDFLPLFPEETEATIRARWNAWANEGLDPGVDVDQWTDTREGSFFWVASEPGVRETARVYDLMGTEVPASGFVLWGWGEYLDDKGEELGRPRNPGVYATGEVAVTAAAGTLIAAGSEFGVEPVDEDGDAPEFVSTEEATVPGGGTVTIPVVAKEVGPASNVAAGAITEVLTPIAGATVTNAEETVGGTDAETDEAYRVALLGRYEPGAAGNEADYRRWALEEPGVGRVTVIPLGLGAGTVIVVVSTAEGNPVASTVVDSLQQRLDPPAFSTVLDGAHDLPLATITVESTAGARDDGFIRIGDELVEYTGKTATTFTGASGGTEAYADGEPVFQTGRGGGVAPVGHHVVVKTATVLNVTVAGTVEPEEGYSLDGAGGTIALQGSIEDALASYIDSVESGGEVVLAQVSGRIAGVTGVHDVGGLTLNGAAANLAVAASPPRVPSLLAANLVEGSL
jgi:uncharacterized phage protein gp47/JayE